MKTSGEYVRSNGAAVRAYEQAHGDPIGRPCFHCGESIRHRWTDSVKDAERFPYREAFTVHHRDYDSHNNEPSNLTPSHHRCNSADLSPAGRERNRRAVSKALKGRRLSPERRAAMRAGWTPERRTLSAETLRRIQRRRYRCKGCSLVSTPGGVKLHQLHSGHEGRERVR